MVKTLIISKYFVGSGANPMHAHVMWKSLKKDDPSNLSSHDALIGRIRMSTNNESIEKDYSDTYEAFEPRKILWKESQEYKSMTSAIPARVFI